MTARAGTGRGFALPAALVGLVVFASVAMGILEWGQGTAAMLQAQAVRARLDAAADAGLMLAIHGLGLDAPAERWRVGGPARVLGFDGVTLSIAVADERGKVPLNTAESEMVRALLGQLGVSGLAQDALADAIEDWIDEDDTARPAGAERQDYGDATPGPRNGPFRSLDEIARVRGMTGPLATAMADLVTLVPRADPGIVEARHAGPAVLAIVKAQGDAGGTDDGFVTALSPEPPGDSEPLALRLISIAVTASLGQARLARTAIVEFTGDRRQPYWLRSYR